MDHAQFKAKQTAAVYVADGLDENTLEAFELHMMGCNECVEDVEAWRAVKLNMPVRKTRPTFAPAAFGRNASAMAGWRMAASLLTAVGLGAAAGWLGHQAHTANIDSTQTVFFNVPATTRGAGDCTALRIGADTKFAVLRIAGVEHNRQVVLADAEKRELPTSLYTARVQPDGSHLVRVDAQALTGREVLLEAHAADGFGEPLGCVTGEVAGR